MKVGRREFLKLAGSAMVSVAVPVRDKEVEEPGFETVEQIINTGFVDRLDGEPCESLSLDKYAQCLSVGNIKWILSTHDRDDCPTCRELSGKPWVEPEPPPEPEYDCDYYFPISEGSQVHEWTDPITGVPHHAVMEWFDHGLCTYLMVDGFNVGKVLSREVPDPGAYLRSIWSCGLVAAAYMIAGPEKLWSPKT